MDPMPNISNNTDSLHEGKHGVFYLSYTLAWICTAAWLASFCPQIYLNWKRSSVVGLSFDFLAFNTVGFLVYSVYVISLLWIPGVKAENEADHSGTGSRVHISDAVFSLLALFLNVVTVVQSAVYERGEQKVSEWTRITLVVLAIVVVTSLIVPATASSRSSWTWLDSVVSLSYIKVGVTVLKYWPQVILNYRRKSTEGWSVHNVLLDFGGGWISLIQMFIDATASGSKKWPSSFQNIALYWLCVITLVFDSIFLMQHYALYARNPPGYQPINQTLNGVLEPADAVNAQENYAGRDTRRGYPPRNIEAGWGGLQRERQPLINRTQHRVQPNVSRAPPIDHVAGDRGSGGTLDTDGDVPVRAPHGGQSARQSRPPGNNCIHGPGHACFAARENSAHAAQEVSEDISINSPTDNNFEAIETENSPALNRHIGSGYGAINPTGAVNGHPYTREINARDTGDNIVNTDTLHIGLPERDEIERSRRELHALGVNFS